MLGARGAKRTLAGVASAALLGVLLAGCGHSASVGGDRTLRLALKEYSVLPEQVRASAGQLTIIVHNVGKMTHNLVITQGSQRVDGTPPIWPGTTSVLSVNLAPGSYTLTSTLFSDQALGEYGTLTIAS